jgi:hypothetical protein
MEKLGIQIESTSLKSKLHRICTQSHRRAKSRRENKINKVDRDGCRIWGHTWPGGRRTNLPAAGVQGMGRNPLTQS